MHLPSSDRNAGAIPTIGATGSPRWTPAQKAAVWVLTAGSVGCSLLFLLIAATSAEPTIPLAMALVTLVAGSFIAGLSLLPGLSPRRDHPAARWIASRPRLLQGFCRFRG
jgi:hypothetical protein